MPDGQPLSARNQGAGIVFDLLRWSFRPLLGASKMRLRRVPITADQICGYGKLGSW
jgi:hypothetical protein